MIRTILETAEYQIKLGVPMLRNGQEELGMRILKAEATEPVGFITIDVKNDHEVVYSIYDYAPRGIVTVGQTRILVKLAYLDAWKLNEDKLRHILNNKNWEDTDRPSYSLNSTYSDEGIHDRRYHAFRAANMEIFMTVGKSMEDKWFTCLFRDIDTGRDIITQTSQNNILTSNMPLW